jgi:hypothetical protein
VFPYLGPEIIAVLQAAGNATRDDSRWGYRLRLPTKGEGGVMASPVLPSSLPCSNATTVAVSVTMRWLP